MNFHTSNNEKEGVSNFSQFDTPPCLYEGDSKGLLVTLKRLSSKDRPHPNPLCSLSNVHRTFS